MCVFSRDYDALETTDLQSVELTQWISVHCYTCFCTKQHRVWVVDRHSEFVEGIRFQPTDGCPRCSPLLIGHSAGYRLPTWLPCMCCVSLTLLPLYVVAKNEGIYTSRLGNVWELPDKYHTGSRDKGHIQTNRLCINYREPERLLST